MSKPTDQAHNLRVIRLNHADNVAVARSDLHAGESFVIGEATLVVRGEIAAGHKIALRGISVGEPVLSTPK